MSLHFHILAIVPLMTIVIWVALISVAVVGRRKEVAVVVARWVVGVEVGVGDAGYDQWL
jgi:hypothetical protein